MNLTPIARKIFLDTLQLVSISEAIRSKVYCIDGVLHIGELTYHLQEFHRVLVVAVGKAAYPMCEALLTILEVGIMRRQVIEGIAVSSTLPRQFHPCIKSLRGGHPFPDHDSQQAADAILQLLSTADRNTLVLFMVSGGASAMIEMPLDTRISLEETAAFHQALVRSGLPIIQMNALRKHFSQVKGGRLSVAAQGSTQCTLLISDVPVDALHMVGSGPSLPDPSTIQQSLQVIESNFDALHLTHNVLTFFRSEDLEETPKAEHPAFRTASWVSLLSSEDLCRSAALLATRAGFTVAIDNRCDDWDYRAAARYLIDQLVLLREESPRACVISAGELSVKLENNVGTGGRNQQFVLECARLIANENLKITVLSGGSDGVDGNSTAAGAVCDEGTWTAAIGLGLNPAANLKEFDSFPLFEALGNTIHTGPTGNNLRDLRILISAEA